MTKNEARNSQSQSITATTFKTKYGRYKDLCEAFGVSRTTVWRWIKEPGFPDPVKRGRIVLFDIAAVDAWLNNAEAL